MQGRSDLRYTRMSCKASRVVGIPRSATLEIEVKLRSGTLGFPVLVVQPGSYFVQGQANDVIRGHIVANKEETARAPRK